MYNVSQNFKNQMRSKDRNLTVKIVIDGVEFLTDKIVSMDIENSISSSDKFSLGEVISSTLKFTLKDYDLAVAINAEVKPYVQFTSPVSEWVPLGVFYVDNRQITESRLWEFECKDASIFLHQDYITGLEYPQTMRAVLTDLCTRLGLEIANIDLISPTYQIQLMPTEITCHQVVSYIASANGCSAIMDRNGKLKFIKIDSSIYQLAETLTPRDYYKATKLNEVKVIDTVKLYERSDYEEGEFSELIRGNGGADTTLTIVNPFMTEPMLDAVYDQIKGFQYIPCKIDYVCFPNLDVGDGIEIGQVRGISWAEADVAWGDADFAWNYGTTDFKTIALRIKTSYKGGLRSTITAESESTQTSEFKVKGSIKEYIEKVDKSALKEGKPYNGVTTSREYGVRVEKTDGSAKVEMNATEGISIYSDLGSGLAKNFFVGLDGRIQAKGIDIDGSGTFSGTLSGADGTFSGTLSGGSIKSDTIIEVTTDAIIGDSIRLGSVSDNVKLEKSTTGFYLSRNNDKILKFWTNGLWVDGNIAVPYGGSIGMFYNFDNEIVWSKCITLSNDIPHIKFLDTTRFEGKCYVNADVEFVGSRYIYGGTTLELRYGISTNSSARLTINNSGLKFNGNIGFFNTTPVAKKSITNLSSSATPEQTRQKVIDLINALQSYGLI
jgi:hypothetical protein